jgi:hypothetical protein
MTKNLTLGLALVACGGEFDDGPSGVVDTTQSLYTISFNLPPWGDPDLPVITCKGADPPNNWSYYGAFCTADDGVRSQQVFHKFGRNVEPYASEGCVCVRINNTIDGACWMTAGDGPDIGRDKQHLRQLRAGVGVPGKNWWHENRIGDEYLRCSYTVRRCSECASTPIPYAP